jgi:NAD(P)-dependent dehydrogenase (short-subunit alcohol dehydrogenase family)
VDINLQNAEKGATLIAERFPNVKALAAKGDVGQEADVKAAVEKAVKEFGRLDVMVRTLPLRLAIPLTAHFSLTMLVCSSIDCLTEYN